MLAEGLRGRVRYFVENLLGIKTTAHMSFGRRLWKTYVAGGRTKFLHDVLEFLFVPFRAM